MQKGIDRAAVPGLLNLIDVLELIVDRFNLKFPSSRESCRSWGISVPGYCGVWWTARPLDPTGTWRVCYWGFHDLQWSLLRLARPCRDDQHRLECSKLLAVCHGCKGSVVVWIQSTIRSSNPWSCIWGLWKNGYEHCGELRRCRVIEVDSADLTMMACQVLWKRPQILKEHLDDANVIWCLRKLEILAWDHILYVITLEIVQPPRMVWHQQNRWNYALNFSLWSASACG